MIYSAGDLINPRFVQLTLFDPLNCVAYILGEEKEEQKVCKFLCGDAHLFPACYRRR